MCGIVGVFNYEKSEPVEERLLKRMRDSMVHRGPDGEGIWLSADRRIGFGHRRLSIIDLSESASQPMCNEDATVWIVFNGEIYNHLEIKAELKLQGHLFKTDHSDTEVIIHAYEQWGKDCVHKFRGMFAFVIWDDNSRELWCFRDRIGIKPLYYTFVNGKFMFASEIKAILVHPDVSRAVNEESFYHYLTFLTTPAPSTLFRGINKLNPGSYARIQNDGRLQTNSYWDVWDHTEPLTNIPDEQIADRLLEELKTAVQCHKVSDVPVGVFLSGGIDSSTNAVLFSEGETNPVRTFSIGYDKEYQSYKNEFSYARVMAELIGASHHEKQLVMNDLMDFLPKLIYHQDEPIADPVCLPVYYVSKLAKDNGVTVCQVGEGSDELFCGYPGWQTLLRLQKLSNIPLAGPLKRIGLAILRIMGKDQKHYFELLRRGASGLPMFWGGAEAFTESEKGRLISQPLRQKFGTYSSFESLSPILERFRENAWEKSPLNWMSYLDLKFRLPELLLMRVDKMSMATSLEARVPFLDHKFVELAMSIPESVKVRNGELKSILKKAVHGLIPDEIINRPKQGFNVPVYEWFFDKLGDFAREKVVNFTKRTDFFDKSYIEALIDTGRGIKLWCVLNFVLWHERWIEGRSQKLEE